MTPVILYYLRNSYKGPHFIICFHRLEESYQRLIASASEC
jgi:hypothetical protein